MKIFSLLKIIKFYLGIIKQQMFSIYLLFNQSLKTLTHLNSQMSQNFNIFDEINIIINKFWSHLKIMKQKQKSSIKRKFTFKPFAEELYKNIFNDLFWNEAAGGDIPLNLIKETTFIFPYVARCVSEDSEKSEVPEPLKLSNIVPVQKKRILLTKQITCLLVYYHQHQKYLKR